MLINRILSAGRRFSYTINRSNPLFLLNVCRKSTIAKHKDPAEELDAPVKYTSSPAKNWKASTSRLGYENTRLWYEPYVIIVSLTIFMVYFGYLREENDVDEELTKSLYNRIEGLEEQQLRVSLKYNQERGLDTSKILQRLAEIEQEKHVKN